jgi:hypothetical protein
VKGDIPGGVTYPVGGGEINADGMSVERASVLFHNKPMASSGAFALYSLNPVDNDVTVEQMNSTKVDNYVSCRD